MRAFFVTSSVAALSVAIGVACTGSDPDISGAPDAGETDAGVDGPSECTEATDKTSDPQNCGACGSRCGAGFACVESKCASDVVDVAGGGIAACALLRGGKVYCWGGAEYGILGEDAPKGTRKCSATEPCRPEPGPVPGIEGATRIAVGAEHACAIVSGGAIKCWGRNHHGQLGTASALPSQGTPVLLPLPVGTVATEIAAGGDTTCAVTALGEVYCWGDNEDGQVGRAPSAAEPAPNKVVSGGARFVAVSSLPEASEIGDGHACAIIGEKVQCWGGNANGQLGRGTLGPLDPAPGPVSNGAGELDRIVEVGVGAATSCARRDVGDVWCWGRNGFGVVPPPSVDGGNVGADGGLTVATKVPGLPGEVSQLSMSLWTQLVLLKNGDVWGWGATRLGALGNGVEDGGVSCEFGYSCTAVAVKSTELPGVARVRAGGTGLALTKDGRVIAWGGNNNGILGHLPGEQGDVETEEPGDIFIGLKPVVVPGLPPP